MTLSRKNCGWEFKNANLKYNIGNRKFGKESTNAIKQQKTPTCFLKKTQSSNFKEKNRCP